MDNHKLVLLSFLGNRLVKTIFPIVQAHLATYFTGNLGFQPWCHLQGVLIGTVFVNNFHNILVLWAEWSGKYNEASLNFLFFSTLFGHLSLDIPNTTLFALLRAHSAYLQALSRHRASDSTCGV